MRLVGGETEAEGRVELCNNERWGTVCDNEWTDKHTSVVCRHLGFSDVIGGMHCTQYGKVQLSIRSIFATLHRFNLLHI